MLSIVMINNMVMIGQKQVQFCRKLCHSLIPHFAGGAPAPHKPRL